MIIDMHVHTEISGDANATVEQYCRAIQQYRQFHSFDGIVLTEHRIFQPDDAIQRLGEKYNVMIFHGAEIETDLGHLLLYGITNQFLKRIDITNFRIESKKVFEIINDCGGIAIPAHPFRESRYGEALTIRSDISKQVKVIEALNGCNSAEQNEKATAMAEQNGLKGIGGSDAHYVNKKWFLTCATEFEGQIHTVEDLVKELHHGTFRPVFLENSMLEGF